MATNSIAEFRICPKCGITKEAALFDKNKGRKDGLSVWCKECKSLHARKFYSENVNEIKQWRLENKNRVKEQSKRYRTSHYEQLKVLNARWREENKEKLKASKKKYRSIKKGAIALWDIYNENKANSYFKNRCPICNRKYVMGLGSHFDHWIPLSDPFCPGTVPWNMIPLCEQCNLSKHDTDAHEWLTRRFLDDPVKVKIIEKRIERFLEYTRDSIPSGN